MISDLFWLVATAHLVLSIGLVLRLRRVRKRDLVERHFALATGQRQDSWLSCGIVWAVILSKGSTPHEPFCIAGAAVLAWLIARTMTRLFAVLENDTRRHGDG